MNFGFKTTTNDDELQVLVMLAINTLHNWGIEFNTSVPQTLKKQDIFDNAKYEQIACNGLQPKYDGSPDELIPTLNTMHIQHQNEAWYVATFLIQDGSPIDLVWQFSQVRQETVQKRQVTYGKIQIP